VAASHVQVAPDSTGKDVDADALTSTESGTPTVYRQNMIISDPTTYANKAAVSSTGAVKFAGETPGTGTITSVAGATSSTTLLASNAARKQAIFYNDSTANLYLGLTASAVSTTAFTVKIGPNGSYFEVPWPVYTGQVTGIWDAATGNVRVTELT
jgi:hypothetical protein